MLVSISLLQSSLGDSHYLDFYLYSLFAILLLLAFFLWLRYYSSLGLLLFPVVVKSHSEYSQFQRAFPREVYGHRIMIGEASHAINPLKIKERLSSGNWYKITSRMTSAKKAILYYELLTK